MKLYESFLRKKKMESVLIAEAIVNIIQAFVDNDCSYTKKEKDAYLPYPWRVEISIEIGGHKLIDITEYNNSIKIFLFAHNIKNSYLSEFLLSVFEGFVSEWSKDSKLKSNLTIEKYKEFIFQRDVDKFNL